MNRLIILFLCLSIFASLVHAENQTFSDEEITPQSCANWTDQTLDFEQALIQYFKVHSQSKSQDNTSCLFFAANQVVQAVFLRPGSIEYRESLVFLNLKCRQLENRQTEKENVQEEMKAIEELLVILQNKWIVINYSFSEVAKHSQL